MQSKFKRFTAGLLGSLMVVSSALTTSASTWVRQPNTNSFVLRDITQPNYVNFRDEKMWAGDFKENADGSGRDVSPGSKLLMENMNPQKFYNFIQVTVLLKDLTLLILSLMHLQRIMQVM